MTKEAHASQIYLSYGAWADSNGLVVSLIFFSGMRRRKEII
jgi:ferritin